MCPKVLSNAANFPNSDQCCRTLHGSSPIILACLFAASSSPLLHVEMADDFSVALPRGEGEVYEPNLSSRSVSESSWSQVFTPLPRSDKMFENHMWVRCTKTFASSSH